MSIKENIIILANRRSRGYRDVYRRHLLNIFAKRRNASIYYLSPGNGNLFSSLQSAIHAATDVIIAGGDGTFESALNYKPLQKKSLGFFPLGAGNSFYSYFYKGNRFEYLRSRFHFKEINLDVLELELDHRKVQTLFLSVGIDAEVIRLAKERTNNGFSDYLFGSIRAFLRGNASYDLAIIVDKKANDWQKCSNITLGKIPFHGFGMRSLLGKIPPADSFVYGLAYRGGNSSLMNKIVRLWALLLMVLGIRQNSLIPFRGKEITLQSNNPFPVQAGGEFIGYSKSLKVRVIRKQKVLVI